MLDESNHASYYEVYMRQHPEDKLPTLIDTLIGQFASDMKKDHIDFYRRNGLDAMMLGDIESEGNWGTTFRDGQQVLVIVDAGFDFEVYDKYYK